MKNKLTDLYNHLFEMLEVLKEAEPVVLDSEIKRANAVRSVAGTLIDAAKLEVNIRKLNKNVPQSAFFDVQDGQVEERPKQLGPVPVDTPAKANERKD